MLSKNLQKNCSFEASEICKFYAGKTIFITGATGYVGSVLLETLLRCCPDIAKIYILLRSKKGVPPEDRKELIFQKEIFIKLKETCPDVLKKVIAVSGDTSEENLGLIENDYNNLTKEVSIVFHIAAAISFSKPIGFIVRQNVIGTDNVIKLCQKSENLECFVYTSSVFSNANQKDVIEEKIYDLPFSSEEVVKAGRLGNEDELMRLHDMCKPGFPNFYTFSKCVAENLLKEKVPNLSVCIIRPSIIYACLKGPLPGYFEEGSAFVELSVGVGKGFIRVLPLDRYKRVEIIPVDVVANSHVVGAYHHVSNSLPSPSVFNCVSGELATLTWGDYVDTSVEMLRSYPVPNTFVYPTLFLCKNPLSYQLWCLFLHYIPAAVIDFLLWIGGSKLRLLKMYKYFDKSMRHVEFFTRHHWDMKNKNFQSLSKGFNALEEEMFGMDLNGFTFEAYKKVIPTGASIYRINGKPYQDNLKWKCLRSCVTFLLLILYPGSMALLLYLIFSRIF